MFSADGPVDGTGDSTKDQCETPITPTDAVIRSGVPGSEPPITPASAVLRDGVPNSAEYVVHPEQRGDDSIHSGLIRRFLQASADIEG